MSELKKIIETSLSKVREVNPRKVSPDDFKSVSREVSKSVDELYLVEMVEINTDYEREMYLSRLGLWSKEPERFESIPLFGQYPTDGLLLETEWIPNKMVRRIAQEITRENPLRVRQDWVPVFVGESPSQKADRVSKLYDIRVYRVPKSEPDKVGE